MTTHLDMTPEAGVDQPLVVPTVNAISEAVIQEVERSVLEKVQRGEFGVLAAAKAAAPGAFRRLQVLAKTSDDEKVRLTANLKLIELAGIKPPAPQVTESPERLIDAMDANEAREFAQTGVFPPRFADALARLPIAVLQEHERRRWQPVVDPPGE